MKVVPGLHRQLSNHQRACRRRENRVGLVLVANETRLLARRSDGRPNEWIPAANRHQHMYMPIRQGVPSKRTSPGSQLLLPTSDLCTLPPTVEERRRIRMAMCRRQRSVQLCHARVRRIARRARRLKWTSLQVSAARRKQMANVQRLIPLRSCQT